MNSRRFIRVTDRRPFVRYVTNATGDKTFWQIRTVQIQIRTEILYCCRVAVFFAGGFFSFLSPISSNPTYTT
jgi:hypothetical protein